MQWKGAHQTVDLDAGTNATLISKNLHDLSGGIQLGYNKKLENNFLVGIEASIDKANTVKHMIFALGAIKINTLIAKLKSMH